MKKILILLILVLCSCSSSDNNNPTNTSPTPTPTQEFIRGADMSYLPLIESEGTIYKHNNQAENALITLKNAGCNYIRIRLWKDPADVHSGLAEVKALATRVTQAGMKVWLTVHYSDTWADPGSQTKPVAWQNLSFSDLKLAVASYTTTVLNEIHPDIFQIGNEINDGLLFPDGKLSTNQSQCLQILQTASSTIRTVSPSTKIMIHYAGTDGSDYFFDKIKTIDYDLIGLSYYPLYHGKNLVTVQNTINTLGQLYNKNVVIAETAYPFTLGFNDYTNNVFGLSSQLIPAFPATNDGQKAFLSSLKNTISQNLKGRGFCYWGSEWVAFRGPTSTNGSPWENQSLWDFNLNSLPVLDVFNSN
ncbi:MAG: glycosyl hydrolase 53 family protein [Flavobacterium sp.]|nr:glycosyl hydrolase 53 family protein [Flavobacterium sp.]